jgi:hypothetical protein
MVETREIPVNNVHEGRIYANLTTQDYVYNGCQGYQMLAITKLCNMVAHGASAQRL